MTLGRLMALRGKSQPHLVPAPMGNSLQILWDDGERVFCRGRRPGVDSDNVLFARPAAEHTLPASLDRLAHEYGLKDELESAWLVRPLELARKGGRTVLVLEDPGGEPLARLLGAPMEMDNFLRLAVGIAAALGKLHQRGLVHKDLKPTNKGSSIGASRPNLTGHPRFGMRVKLALTASVRPARVSP